MSGMIPVILCPTLDMALGSVWAFDIQGVRVVIGAPQGPEDRWMIVPQEGQGVPFFIGEDSWSCYMRSLCRG